MDTQLYTMLPVPNPFVVPGARFREVYYWDSFFVIQGLLASNLTTLAENILDNFAYLVQVRMLGGRLRSGSLRCALWLVGAWLDLDTIPFITRRFLKSAREVGVTRCRSLEHCMSLLGHAL